MRPACSVSECETQSVKRGYCHKHYSRWIRYGDTGVMKGAAGTPGMTPEVKAKYVRDYKLGHGCVDCGYQGHFSALDFDHRPGTTKVREIKSGRQFGWEALLAEIAKCDVVCANCHRIRTFRRRGGEDYEYVVYPMATAGLSPV